jgi:hypothetical protein
MVLDCVTITGADDRTNPDELVALSKEFPFVEWGILFSRTQTGSPRFPSQQWLYRLSDRALKNPMRLSAHLCGWYMRETLAGSAAWWRLHPYNPIFQRIQLNFHGQVQPADIIRMFRGVHERARAYIFQCDGVNDAWIQEFVDEGYGSPLFDRSGGAGVLPDDWPPLWLPYSGYAGGLGPDNVVEQVQKIIRTNTSAHIHRVAADASRVRLPHFWIDMERRVRSDDDLVFDMVKVRTVLETCAPHVTGRPGGY